MNRTERYESPFTVASDPEKWGTDNFSQVDLLRRSFEKFLERDFEASRDLRGAQFAVSMSDDGLHILIRASYNGS